MFKLKKQFFVGFAVIAILIVIAYPFRRQIKHKVKAFLGHSVGAGVGGSGNCPTCPGIFTDNVKTHELAYSKDGIKPQKDDTDLDKLSLTGKLLKLQTDSLYIVRKTRFSRPYITPRAHSFIQDLSKRYYKRCVMDSIKYGSIHYIKLNTLNRIG